MRLPPQVDGESIKRQVRHFMKEDLLRRDAAVLLVTNRTRYV